MKLTFVLFSVPTRSPTNEHTPGTSLDLFPPILTSVENIVSSRRHTRIDLKTRQGESVELWVNQEEEDLRYTYNDHSACFII